MAYQNWISILVLTFCLSFLHLNISEATRPGALISSSQHKIIQEKQDNFTNAHVPYNDILRRILRGGGGKGGGSRSFHGGGHIVHGGSHKNGSSISTARNLLAFVLFLCALNAFVTLA